ncbi:MAG: Plastocyanin [Candidatus Daviesbacteria bacterium GW2011_GWA2_40_9]|uniref:Plastocyanin n=1 Tax=Candidatus Daviesbacteria bacterium GW2011_GWA2_40_9 TaxID=1618424 RepID=A0A0G0U127_9BACT|nr:MAG: Plastocyanin [Candidatus Daviesbacteria bacterium GW2011_GWA2_40_9]
MKAKRGCIFRGRVYHKSMNNKVMIGLIVIIILFAGSFFLLNKNNSTTPQSNSSQNTQVLPSPTNAQTTSGAEPQQTQNVVTYTVSGFSPATLTVKAGTTVTWVNKSGSNFSLNSNPHPVHTDYPPLNIGITGDGQSKSLTFDKLGTYGYHNHLNPSDTGEVIVQ